MFVHRCLKSKIVIALSIRSNRLKIRRIWKSSNKISIEIQKLLSINIRKHPLFFFKLETRYQHRAKIK